MTEYFTLSGSQFHYNALDANMVYLWGLKAHFDLIRLILSVFFISVCIIGIRGSMWPYLHDGGCNIKVQALLLLYMCSINICTIHI